ncbi:SDR family oxidoreductase [Arthrobacter agilis]|uniref:SDR family oxidoreductase n=1 Tax=Arthrobacter agilis TaxID=37921 RepID=UPI000B36141D|nr:SDR family oxidoreductase [Arthrobacter agilis]OUM40619.1 3-ketoacyl-ACP reductase [Arthrobacter agilis]PPB45231.1 3-ketoacyl-ACP reductase [Arthrobacter agilis]TPV27934.1 SDR family oxidoreductase [Arthrobacter agilis]VDR31384.1 Glucose 1-dehydrogenase 2 [Arthrobacter agilis]
MESTHQLSGRTVVVTGVSRRRGIGFAVASRLADMGASLYLHHYSRHDSEQPWGADRIEDVVDAVRRRQVPGASLAHGSIDLSNPDGAEQLIREARAASGHLDGLVCNHARSGSDGRLGEISWRELDAHWQVNARSTLLATKYFAEQHDGREGGRVIWMTSGQHAGPMPTEIAYAASKAVLAGLTASVADDLVEQGILLNTVNPGPVNTGYLDAATADRSPEILDAVLAHFPGGRFGEPDDPARLIAWLVSDEGRWMVGQVLSSEGGFRRW